MPAKPTNPAKIKKAVDGWNQISNLTYAEAAKKLGLERQTFKRYLQLGRDAGLEVNPCTNSYTANHPGRISLRPAEYEVEPQPDDDLPVEEIIAFRKKEFERKKKAEEAGRLIRVKVKIDGPIGLLHFGDPHVDDDGTDIGLLEAHSKLTHQEGLFGATVGDLTNNWTGRLARLYSQQNMGRKRAIKVAEWWLKSTRLLYIIGGNHDAWSGDDDPIQWIKNSSTLFRSSEVRIGLQFPSGQPAIINGRHDFAGGSMWNPAHGAMKAAQLSVRDDILTCGHKHISGYGVVKDPDSGRISHCIQIGSYKIYDRYGKERGFRDQTLGPAAFTTIRPDMPPQHPDRVKLFWDPFEGADYLKFLRRKR